MVILPYKWNYWQVAICLNNASGRILNWQISVLYGEKPGLIMAYSQFDNPYKIHQTTKLKSSSNKPPIRHMYAVIFEWDINFVDFVMIFTAHEIFLLETFLYKDTFHRKNTCEPQNKLK